MTTTSKFPETVRIAHSPDADDRFMFWPLRAGLVKLPHPVEFEFTEADTQSLNQLSLTAAPDICAISAIHYGRIWDTYQPLRTGSSVGDDYGPVVVVTKARAQALKLRSKAQNTEDWNGKTLLKDLVLLTPGATTTAHSVVRMLGYEFTNSETVPITPIERVFERLEALEAEGVASAALLIHEGRLIFDKFGCEKAFDIGPDWKALTGGSLPLGINVIKRDLEPTVRKQLADLVYQSCAYAMAHVDDYIKASTDSSSPFYSPLSADELKHYLNLYANQTTLEMSPQDKASFTVLLQQGFKLGLFLQTQGAPRADWI